MGSSRIEQASVYRTLKIVFLTLNTRRQAVSEYAQIAKRCSRVTRKAFGGEFQRRC